MSEREIMKVQVHDGIVGLMYLVSVVLANQVGVNWIYIAVGVAALQIASPFTKFCLGSGLTEGPLLLVAKVALDQTLFAVTINLAYAFQNVDYLVLVMDICDGGDLAEFGADAGEWLTAAQMHF